MDVKAKIKVNVRNMPDNIDVNVDIDLVDILLQTFSQLDKVNTKDKKINFRTNILTPKAKAKTKSIGNDNEFIKLFSTLPKKESNKSLLKRLYAGLSTEYNVLVLRSKTSTKVIFKYLSFYKDSIMDRGMGVTGGRGKGFVEVIVGKIVPESNVSETLSKLPDGNMKRFLVRENIEEWKSNDLVNYVNSKFVEAYGFESFELYMPVRGNMSGKYVMMIKRNIVNTFAERKMGIREIVDYIDWMFEYKGKSLDITVSTLCSKTWMTSWLQHKAKDTTKSVNQSKRHQFKRRTHE